MVGLYDQFVAGVLRFGIFKTGLCLVALTVLAARVFPVFVIFLLFGLPMLGMLLQIAKHHSRRSLEDGVGLLGFKTPTETEIRDSAIIIMLPLVSAIIGIVVGNSFWGLFQ